MILRRLRMLKDSIIKILKESYGDDPEHQAMLNNVADRLVHAVMEWILERLPESIAKAYKTFLEG